MIWRNEFPHIQWEWRVFFRDGTFMTYINATCKEIVATQAALAVVVDWDNHSIDWL